MHRKKTTFPKYGLPIRKNYRNPFCMQIIPIPMPFVGDDYYMTASSFNETPVYRFFIQKIW
jgi:beta-xylosidase